MGTRARIGRINANGSITSIYTHWDGYPSHHLPILSQHYASDDRITALLALGSLSSLAPEIGEKHDFEDRSHANWCTAHGRDRGEKKCKASTSRNEVAFAAACANCWAEYAYLWDGTQWTPYEVAGEPLPQLVAVAPAEVIEPSLI
jgi:hypothetical protein